MLNLNNNKIKSKDELVNHIKKYIQYNAELYGMVLPLIDEDIFTMDDYRELIKTNPRVFPYFQEELVKDYSLQKLAVKKHGANILCIKNPTNELKIMAIKHNASLIRWLLPASKTVIKAAIKVNPRVIESPEIRAYLTTELYIMAIQLMPSCLYYINEEELPRDVVAFCKLNDIKMGNKYNFQAIPF